MTMGHRAKLESMWHLFSHLWYPYRAPKELQK
jgi:hypothetical protein